MIDSDKLVRRLLLFFSIKMLDSKYKLWIIIGVPIAIIVLIIIIVVPVVLTKEKYEELNFDQVGSTA